MTLLDWQKEAIKLASEEFDKKIKDYAFANEKHWCTNMKSFLIHLNRKFVTTW